MTLTTNIKWYERILLFFVKEQYFEDKAKFTCTTYKVFRNKIYVLNISTIPPMGYNCRHQLLMMEEV